MKKILTFFFAGIMISFSASSQTIKQNIDKAIKDKNAKENSAKADVIIQKRTITDSTVTKTKSDKKKIKTPVTTVKHKKHKHKVTFKPSK
jgi:5'-3' exonuclease